MALNGPTLMREDKMAKLKIYDKKYNSLSRTYFFKCIVTECDYTIPFIMDRIVNLSQEEKLGISKARDSYFIDHLRYEHGLELMVRPFYDGDTSEDEEEDEEEE